ncbi:MAG: hypothetical protein IT169_00190 [Bryobacterales bacterium]|nr:hypothetical protein [Bryobacterales bacterium]
MASSKSTVGDLIEKLESLLGQGGRAAPGTGLLSSIAGALDTTPADGGIKEIAGSFAEGLLGGGAGLVAGLLRSLFGGESDPSPTLPAYEKPGALFLEYDVNTQRQGVGDVEPGIAPGRAGNPTGGDRAEAQTGPPTVVVQVNALDAQSFSARSDDIASAVREALARNHALRDEIWED